MGITTVFGMIATLLSCFALITAARLIYSSDPSDFSDN